MPKTWPPGGSDRPFLVPIHGLNTRSESRSHPFSDSFHPKFANFLFLLVVLGARPAPPLGTLAHEYAPGEDVVQSVEVRGQGRRQVQLHNRPVNLRSFVSLRGEDRLSQRLVRLPEVVAGADLRLAHPGLPHDALDLLPGLLVYVMIPLEPRSPHFPYPHPLAI